MGMSVANIMTTEQRLSERKREALIRKVERCLEYGFGSVEVVVKDHRILVTHYKETEKED